MATKTRTSANTKHGKQGQGYRFLRSLSPGDRFTAAQLATAAGWTESTARTHITKHYRDWVTRDGAGFRIKAEFNRVSFEEFVGHSRQTRRAFADYRPTVYTRICVFEFLLPMSREAQLKAALDELFYENTLRRRFTEIGVEHLQEIVAPMPKENVAAYLDRVLEIVSGRFSGYSITLVAGRFRVGRVRDQVAAATQNQDGVPYLIDETTASVRFIVPLAGSREETSEPTQLLLLHELSIEDEARMVRALFFELFVHTVIRTVKGEEVIWLLEDSPLGRQLHEWAKAA